MNGRLVKAGAVLFAIGASVVGAAFAVGSWIAIRLDRLIHGPDDRTGG